MAASLEEKIERIREWQERGDEPSIHNLLRTLINDSEPEARQRAALALGKIPSSGRQTSLSIIIEGLSRACGDKVFAVRIKAIEAMGKIGGDSAVQALGRLIQDRTASERMLAAERLDELGDDDFGDVFVDKNALDRLRNEAWDLQWAAAQALGKLASVPSTGAVLGWCERLLLSDVRVMSATEKTELIRATLAGLFRKLEAGQIYDLSKAIEPSITVYSWEKVGVGAGTFGWVHAKRKNPIFLLFQEEMERRKTEYMRSLDRTDTLFTGAGAGSGSATPQPNRKDTLFQAAAPNSKDTLFNPIANEPSAESDDDMPLKIAGPAEHEMVANRKAELMKALNQYDSLFLSKSKAGAKPALTADPTDRAELDRRMSDYMKSLGPQDSLFVPAKARRGPPTSDEMEGLFGEESEPTDPPPPPPPAALPRIPRPPDNQPRTAHDTLFIPLQRKPSPPSKALDEDSLFGDMDAPPPPPNPAAGPRLVTRSKGTSRSTPPTDKFKIDEIFPPTPPAPAPPSAPEVSPPAEVFAPSAAPPEEEYVSAAAEVLPTPVREPEPAFLPEAAAFEPVAGVEAFAEEPVTPVVEAARPIRPTPRPPELAWPPVDGAPRASLPRRILSSLWHAIFGGR